MNLTLPELCLVLLVGPSGAGKTTFARRHFRPTEIVSSDACRALVRDDETDQSATGDAFDVLHLIAARRLAAGRLTVIDATNLRPDARKPLLVMAAKHHVPPVALAFDLPEPLCHQFNRQRPDRVIPAHVITTQCRHMETTRAVLTRERYHRLVTFTTPADIDAVRIERQRLPVNRRDERGPFDIVGDVHGCLDELRTLLDQLGRADGAPPPGRKLVFVGDLVDRGPDTPGVLRLVMDLIDAGRALCVRGNHDDKLLRKLRGGDVKMTHGLAESLAQLAREPPEFTDRVRAFLETLPNHLLLDGGKLVVAHAGLKEEMHGRVSEKARAFALYGDTTGETDAYGLPVRRNWAAEYAGRALVVYGHTPVVEPLWVRRTVNIDTGCVFGGRLTALRYPEEEVVAVPAQRMYSPPNRPLLTTLDVPATVRPELSRRKPQPPGA